MELIEVPLTYFFAAFLIWLATFVWFVKYPEWIGASVLVFMFFMPVIVDSVLGGTHLPTGQIIVLFFFPALFVSLSLKQVTVSWNDLLLVGAYGAVILGSVVLNDMSFWGNKAAVVPLVFALVIYFSVDSRKALHRILYVYIALIVLNTGFAGLQRLGFEWAYPDRRTYIADAGGYARGFGLAGNFTVASLYATITIPLALTLFLRSRRLMVSILSFIFCMLGVAGQVFSVSRSGVLGAAMGVLVVVKRGVTSRAVMMGTVFTVIGIVVATSTPVVRQSSQDLFQHLTVFTSESREIDESAASRPEWAMLGVQSWQQDPVFGGGPHAVKRAFNRDPHNTFVNVLASYGIVGFILFLAILYRCYRHTLRAARMGYEAEGAALGGALVSTLPIAFFHSLDYIDLFWFIPALCLASARLPDRRRVREAPPVVFPESAYAMTR